MVLSARRVVKKTNTLIRDECLIIAEIGILGQKIIAEIGNYGLKIIAEIAK